MAKPCRAAPTYERRQPEQTVLYRTVQAHLATFLAPAAGGDGTPGLPGFVKREFEAYLQCGLLGHGLLRVRCERCGDTFHSLVLDGVYTRPTPSARPVFLRLPPPTDADIAALLARLQRRVRRLLARRGRLPEADSATDPFAAQEPLFAG